MCQSSTCHNSFNHKAKSNEILRRIQANEKAAVPHALNLHISKNGLANPVLSSAAIGGLVSTVLVSIASGLFAKK